MSPDSNGRRASATLVIQEWISKATKALFLFFVGSIPAEYSLILPGVGSVTRLLGALLMLMVTIDVLGGRKLRSPSLALALLAGFVVWSLLSSFWSVDTEQTVIRVFTYTQLLVMGWVVYEYTRTWNEFVSALQYFVVGSLLVACVTIREFSLVNLATLAVTDLRVSAFGANPNELGLAMAITVPVALFLVRLKPGGVSLLLNGAYLVIGPVAVLLTASRGAVVVLGLACLGMVVMLRDMRVPAKVFFSVVVASVAAIGVYMIPAYTWQRIGSIGVSLQRMDFNNRAGNWNAGVEYFLGQPLIGVGAGAFQGATRHLLSTSWSSHSSWLGVLVETGLVGATLWGAAIVMILVGLRRVPAPVRRFLAAAILPMMVGMIVTGWDHRKVPWFMFSIAMAAPFLAAKGGSQRVSGDAL